MMTFEDFLHTLFKDDDENGIEVTMTVRRGYGMCLWFPSARTDLGDAKGFYVERNEVFSLTEQPTLKGGTIMAHDCTFAYPGFSDFVPAAKNVAAKIMGDASVDWACAIHCGWVCVGYGASLIPHDHDDGVYIEPVEALDDKAAAALFQAASECDPTSEGMKAIDWKALISLALKFIEQWLKT